MHPVKISFNLLLLTAFILFQPGNLLGQPSDIPDYRSKKDNFSRVREKDVRSELTSFTMAGISELVGQKNLKKLVPTEYSSNFMQFEADNLSLRIETKPFVKEDHKLMFYEEKFLVRINNKPFYGSYAQIPQTTISKVELLIGKDTVVIPATAYQDLHNPQFYYRDGSGINRSLNALYFSDDGRRIYIYLHNPSTSGRGYEITWVIQDGQYLRRVLDYDLPG